MGGDEDVGVPDRDAAKFRALLQLLAPILTSSTAWSSVVWFVAGQTYKCIPLPSPLKVICGRSATYVLVARSNVRL